MGVDGSQAIYLVSFTKFHISDRISSMCVSSAIRPKIAFRVFQEREFKNKKGSELRIIIVFKDIKQVLKIRN